MCKWWPIKNHVKSLTSLQPVLPYKTTHDFTGDGGRAWLLQASLIADNQEDNEWLWAQCLKAAIEEVCVNPVRKMALFASDWLCKMFDWTVQCITTRRWQPSSASVALVQIGKLGLVGACSTSTFKCYTQVASILRQGETLCSFVG